MRKIIANFKQTYKNKLYALVAMLIGTYLLAISGDGTVLMFLMMFVIFPAFFATEDMF